MMLSKSLIDTKNFAEEFLNDLALRQRSGQATVVLLYGDLGSGKTTFTQSVAVLLGVAENITSPTFVIEKIYDLSPQGVALRSPKATPWGRLIHIDCYRLDNSAEIEKLGWKEIVANPKNLIFVEWPDRIADILPADMIKIDFKFIDETTREINLYA